MGRIKVTAPHKIKRNIPITRIGKKQYLKRRFAHIRKVDLAGQHNELTQKYVQANHTPTQSYLRLGLNTDPSAPKAVIESRKKVVKKEMKAKFEQPEAQKARLGPSISELEGSMIANLIEKYGTDLKRMQLDTKLNPFQLTPSQLQRRIVNYLRYEREAFPEQYAELVKLGWLTVEQFSDPAIRRRKK